MYFPLNEAISKCIDSIASNQYNRATNQKYYINESKYYSSNNKRKDKDINLFVHKLCYMFLLHICFELESLVSVQ